ncbi:MAG: NUDIX hydrolase [Lawsonibacter sp.]|nr:NUDIX hydrolase [Lawsonibacter sp.]
MDLSEKMVSSQTVFEGKIIKVTLDQARLPDGKLASREVVYHPGGVAVLALDEDNTVYLVRQFRYPLQRELLELPAGKLDHGAEEDVLLGAQRELSEETGLEAAEWTYLGYTLASPGFCDEALHMYLARGLTRQKQHLDEDEFLDVITMPFDQLVEQVMDGTIADGKTVSATLKVKVLLGL